MKFLFGISNLTYFKIFRDTMKSILFYSYRDRNGIKLSIKNITSKMNESPRDV
jgi:hypothetical protein